MQIKTLDRTSLKLLRLEMQAAMQEVATKYDIQIEVGSARFQTTSATFKVEISTKGQGGVVNSPERTDFEKYADMYNLKKDWLDATFKFNGQEYRITGLNTRSRKAPVLATRTRDNRGYKFTTSSVVAAMTGKPETFPLRPFVSQSVIIGPANPLHKQIEAEIATMRNENPEGYYADGELRAQGMSEKQIHDHHYRLIAIQLQSKR